MSFHRRGFGTRLTKCLLYTRCHRQYHTYIYLLSIHLKLPLQRLNLFSIDPSVQRIFHRIHLFL